MIKSDAIKVYIRLFANTPIMIKAGKITLTKGALMYPDNIFDVSLASALTV